MLAPQRAFTAKVKVLSTTRLGWAAGEAAGFLLGVSLAAEGVPSSYPSAPILTPLACLVGTIDKQRLRITPERSVGG